jgi:hypothetical protein
MDDKEVGILINKMSKTSQNVTFHQNGTLGIHVRPAVTANELIPTSMTTKITSITRRCIAT